MPSRSPLRAVIWDFDGTIADTRRRNFVVVRRMLTEELGRSPDAIPGLESPEAYDRLNRRYRNWRHLYDEAFGLSEEETDRVGSLWTRYQLEDHTPSPLFDGVANVLAGLRFVPHGIVSMNGRDQIARSLRDANLHDAFAWIVGWEEVHIRRQKPEPDGLLDCLGRLTSTDDGFAIYIGDHETDVRCARKANETLAARGAGLRIVAVAAHFTGGTEEEGWQVHPDYAARRPDDVLEIVRGLLDTRPPSSGC